MNLRDLFFFTATTTLIIWILVVAKSIIVPLVIAVMLTYLLVGAATGLRRLPGMSRCPVWLAYVLALLILGLAIVTLVLVAVENLHSIAASAPVFRDNAVKIVATVGGSFGLNNMPDWDFIRDWILNRVNLAAMSLSLLAALASTGGYMALIATYVVFMVSERRSLSRKVDLVLPDSHERGEARRIFNRINHQIVSYLSTKTLINIILAVISFGMMWILGIENAVFWAFVIGLFNYIPYVGSLLGVGVVVVYDALSSGEIAHVILSGILLTVAQVYVGNILEPRVMSRSFNLSPVVVLAALVIWSSIWGLIGAIIAVPMTSILMIVLAAFDGTRVVPIMASRDGTLEG